MPVLKPWLVIATLLAMIGSFFAGEFHGQRTERRAWELVVAKQSLEASELLRKSEALRLKAERAFGELSNKVELDHAAQESRIEKAYADHRVLLSRISGLYDAKGTSGRACDRDVVPRTSEPPSRDTGSAAGCRLSAETSAALLDLARDADRVAAYAQSCYRWAVGIGDTKY